jgi:hypothetical protein
MDIWKNAETLEGYGILEMDFIRTCGQNPSIRRGRRRVGTTG